MKTLLNIRRKTSKPLFELTNETSELVLKKLNIKEIDQCSLNNLSKFYQEWCRLIPFDNLMKTHKLVADINASLPGVTAEEFFCDWLKYGVGGTCWAGNGAIFALLRTMGYNAEFVAGCMLSDPLDKSSSLGHGSIIVTLDEGEFLIDATMLHGVPINLVPNESSNKTFYFRVERRDDKFQIKWRPLGRNYSFFQINKRNLVESEIFTLHEASRGLSKFNGSPIIRMARSSSLIGVVRGDLIIRDEQGVETFQNADQFCFSQTLVNKFYINQEFSNQIVNSLK